MIAQRGIPATGRAFKLNRYRPNVQLAFLKLFLYPLRNRIPRHTPLLHYEIQVSIDRFHSDRFSDHVC